MRVRTGYSFRTAFGHLDDVMGRVKELGWGVAPITDRCSTFGFNRWTQLAKKNSLRPVYGVEIGVVPEQGVKKPIVDYWTFFAKEKMRPMNELVGLATLAPGREPSVLYPEALEAPDLVKIAGPRVLLDEVDKILRDSKDHLECGDLYVSLEPASPKGLIAEAVKRGYKLVAMSSNYYPSEEDLELYRVILGTYRSSTQTYPMHLLTDVEWHAACEFNSTLEMREEALRNRAKIIDQCRAEMKMGTMLIPEKPKSLRDMCIDGAAKKNVSLEDPVYLERMDRELKLIDEKNFEDYFYLVADIIQWAKQRMIVGPARGSSCGSLVCYLLEITAVDPIPYDLVFERFIDTTRADYPDIDIDFSDVHRHKIFKYAEDKYGRGKVARLGTVSMFQTKSALNQIGAALKIPTWMIGKVSDAVIRRSKGDSRAELRVADTLKETDAGREMMKSFPEAEIVGDMENHPSNAGQHAAGLVLTNEPVVEYVAVDSRTNTAMCDWQDAKDLNLLKLDALGLTQLSIFERCLKLIGKPQNSYWLEALPLDDQAAFDVLNRRHFSGIFQFTGPTLQQICIEVNVTAFEDIVAMTALCRPGPIGSGGTRRWINRKNKKEPITVPHELFEPYTRTSLGIVVYQEQVMRIGRELGGLSWADVTVLRKSMSKSMGKEFFDKYGDPWKNETVRKGVPPPVAQKYWDDMCSFGMYGFNRSHAVAYAMVSYWACYLKAHYPVEFAAATLDAEDLPDRQLQMLRELSGEGIDYKPVDPDHSTDKWQVVVTGDNLQKTLVGPLTQIKGIGPATVRTILDARNTGKPISESIRKKLVAASTMIDSLYPVSDAIKRLHPDLKVMKIMSTPVSCIDIQPGRYMDEVVILVKLIRLYPLDENEPGRVAKRGYAVTGPTRSVNFFVTDDTGDIFCKIGRRDYDRLAPILLNGTRQGKTLLAIKGYCPSDFRMIWVRQIKFLGDVEWTRTDWEEHLAKTSEVDRRGTEEPVPGAPDQGTLDLGGVAPHGLGNP